MEKRPLSLTIIGWIIIVLSLFAIYGVVVAGSNPVMTQALSQMHMSVPLYQAWGTVGVIVSLACAYGILKGLPWSRVLYLVWGIIGLVVGFFISPVKATLVLSIIILVVVCAFLWTNAANDWFSARGLMLKREPDRTGKIFE